MKRFLKPYDLTITLFYALCIVSFIIMYQNNDLLWLIAMPIMGWLNHFIFSLNHRMIAHRAFTAKNKFIHKMIILLNVLQVSHSPMRFAVFHRHHHKSADIPDADIHGPTKGLWESVVGWEYDLEGTFKKHNMKIPRDLMKDEFLVWVDKNYYKILFIFCIALLILSPTLFWYVFVPGSVWFRLTASYFSNYHTSFFGYTNYDLGKDTAKNSIFANIFTCGEGWHNNHHAQPGNWKFGQKWWEWDPPQWAIRNFLIEKK